VGQLCDARETGQKTEGDSVNIKKWEDAKTPQEQLKLLFRWIKQNDNSSHPQIGDTQKMTPKELVENYGSRINLARAKI
jgi:ribosome-binding protein aMBF1 (putative translation factor)